MKKASQDSKKIIEDQKNQVTRPTWFGKNREMSVGPSDIEDEIQIERREAYVDPLTQQILRNLLESGEEGEIIPFYHPASGFTYEAKVSHKGNGPHNIPRDFLEKLVRLDILQESFCDSISTCSNCKSPAITLHNRCPKCKSHHIDKISLTEHIPCGYIEQRDKYINDSCPKCGNELVEGEYRSMGRWYICKECGERFEHSQFDVVCRECNNTFMIEEAATLEIPKFKLNPKRIKEIRQNVASLESISKILTDLGFKIEMPGSVTGHKSGMNYHFSILAKKQIGDKETIIAVDHEVAEDEVQTSPLILYIYKTSEIKVDLPIFIALPRLSENARKIAKGHDILVIEGPTEGQERITQIKAEIESRLGQEVTIIQPNTENAGKSTAKIEKTPQVLTNPPQAASGPKHKAVPLTNVLRKFRRTKKINNHKSSPAKETSEETQLENTLFLLDGSSSMKGRIGNITKFELATKAIENVLTNPDPEAKNRMLSVIIFWDEILKGFQKENLYENLPMSKYISPQKLNQFGKPKKNAGTPLWTAVEYAIDFLQTKKGHKTIKLITDAVDIPPLKDETTISKLEKNSIQLDCIAVSQEDNLMLRKFANNANRGRFFEASNVESLTLALKT